VGFGFATVTPSSTSVAQVGAAAVWTYPQRSLTDIQSLVTAIQNNNPGAVSDYSDLQYVPVPYYAGQVSLTQVAAFIDNAVRNYGLAEAFASYITNNPYNLWTPNTVGAFLSSPYMSQTSVALLLANAGATQMAQALSNLSGNYTNVAIAFSLLVAPSTGANVLNNPNMSLTQAASIINNALINVAPSYPTNVAQLLSLVSSSVLTNINAYPNVAATTLSQLISNAALSSTAAQALLYGLAENYYYNKWINTVTASAGSTTIATNVTVVNPLYSQNLTIASGVTVTCGTHTCFFVAQSFNNYGTIVNPYGAPGGGAAGGDYGSGPGGTGGGGVIILTVTAVLGTVNVNGSVGSTSSTPAAGADYSGNPGGTGLFAVLSGMTVPVGGTGGVGSTTPGSGEPNGGGGGGASYEVGGAGGVSVVSSFSNGNSLITYIAEGLGDWWLANIVGKAPPTVTPLLYVYGSGGGSGGANGNSGFGGGGGGGGGGGEVIVYGYNIISGTIDASGGAGGGAVSSTTTNKVGGGGGGAGGVALLFYNATSGSITASVAGGAGGPISGTGSAGSAGSNGTAYVAAVTVNG
jgi:hypothetical protein